MTETLFGRLSDWLHQLTERGDSPPDVDAEYVRQNFDLCYISVVEIGNVERLRCNLCATLYGLEDAQECISHVSGHQEETAQDINPFEKSRDFGTRLGGGSTLSAAEGDGGGGLFRTNEDGEREPVEQDQEFQPPESDDYPNVPGFPHDGWEGF